MSEGNDRGEIKHKLIETKQKWARDGRLLTGAPDVAHTQRLPPGQKEVKNWPGLDLGLQPDVQTASWRLALHDLVQRPGVLAYAQLLALPQTESLSAINSVLE